MSIEELDDQDREILRFSGTLWQHTERQEATIPDRFGMSVTRFYQRLNELIDSPAAALAEPVIVGRHRRIREDQRRRRSAAR